jgi:hypothetical protein
MSFITEVQHLPEHTKRKILVAGSIACSLVVLALWFADVRQDFQPEPAADTVGAAPTASFEEAARGTVGAAGQFLRNAWGSLFRGSEYQLK